jgi:hypothetical protein
MNSESKLVVELWDYFRDMIGAAKRQDAALHLLRMFEEYGFDIEKLDIQGECDYIDEALTMMLDDESEDEDGYDYGDDED